MSVLHPVISLIIAGIIVIFLSRVLDYDMSGRGTEEKRWQAFWLFLVIVMATWAGGLWAPIIGATLIGLVAFGLVLGIGFALLLDRSKLDAWFGRGNSTFLGALLILLLVVIIAGYVMNLAAW